MKWSLIYSNAFHQVIDLISKRDERRENEIKSIIQIRNSHLYEISYASSNPAETKTSWSKGARNGNKGYGLFSKVHGLLSKRLIMILLEVRGQRSEVRRQITES